MSFIVHYLAIQKFFSSHTLLLRLNFDAFRVLPSELRPTAVHGKFRACREGRVERRLAAWKAKGYPVDPYHQPFRLDTAT